MAEPSPPTHSLAWAAKSDQGPRRDSNEDALGVFDPGTGQALDSAGAIPAAPPSKGWLFLVSDGVGGHKSGEVASRMAIDGFVAALARRLRRSSPVRNEERAEALRQAAAEANGTVRQAAAGDDSLEGMAATLTALWLIDGTWYLVQVGDSRLYRLRGGALRQLSCDQSEIGRQLFEGRISEEQARSMPGRNIIECAIGEAPERFRADVDWGDALPGDTFLLCSDGLSDALENDRIRTLLERHRAASLQAAADALVDNANRAYGRDNATVLLLRVDSTRPGGPGAASRASWPLATTIGALALLIGALLAYLLAAIPAQHERDRLAEEKAAVARQYESTREALDSMEQLLRRVRQAQNDADAASAEDSAAIASLEDTIDGLEADLSRGRERMRAQDQRIGALSEAYDERVADLEGARASLRRAYAQTYRELVRTRLAYEALLKQRRRELMQVPVRP
jgi:protein phosphatase